MATRNIHGYSVQEALNAAFPKVIKIQPTMTVDDNADDDVAFDWTEVPNAARTNGLATILQSVMILDADDSGASIELWFCRGSGDSGTAPTSAQGLIGGATAGSAVVDITAAEAQAINICGTVNCAIGAGGVGDLLLANMLTARDIGLILAPAANTTSLYVGGIWRSEPTETTAVDTLDVYLGFIG